MVTLAEMGFDLTRAPVEHKGAQTSVADPNS